MQRKHKFTRANFSGTDYQKASGRIAYGMTNDYIFRIIFQENKFALKGLLCSLLRLSPEDIKDLEITNEVKPGKSIADKEYRMDIMVILNNEQILNLEMQIKNYGNWPCRSLAYLCREFDSLEHGADYNNVMPTYQISFLDFNLFEDHPEFFAMYQMRNAKDNYLYTDKFNLLVVQLNSTEVATKEDIDIGLVKWARIFKAKTWEELKMIAENNEYMTSAVQSLFLSNEDRNVRKIAREREEFLKAQAYKDARLSELEEQVKEKDQTIAMLQEKLKEYEKNAK
jgi:predicted transposase/invertase (TIGR01784 family)